MNQRHAANEPYESEVSAKVMQMHLPASRAVLFAGLGEKLSRWMPTRSSRTRQLRLVETLNIGQRSSIALVECGGRPMLVGLGRDGVTTITALPAAPVPGGLR